MDRGKRIIGVVVVIVSVFTLIAWEKWGKDRFLYDEILVLNKNVEKGTVITEEMLSEKRIGGTEKDCLSADDREYVIGREAAFFVHKGVPLFREYFQQSSLSADEERGQYLLSVPADWLTCMPASLGRGDKIFFFRGGDFVTSAMVASVDEEKTFIEIVVSDEQASALSKIGGSGEIMTVIYN